MSLGFVCTLHCVDLKPIEGHGLVPKTGLVAALFSEQDVGGEPFKLSEREFTEWSLTTQSFYCPNNPVDLEPDHDCAYWYCAIDWDTQMPIEIETRNLHRNWIEFTTAML
jgi:hypothetical protein